MDGARIYRSDDVVIEPGVIPLEGGDLQVIYTNTWR